METTSNIKDFWRNEPFLKAKYFVIGFDGTPEDLAILEERDEPQSDFLNVNDVKKFMEGVLVWGSNGGIDVRGSATGRPTITTASGSGLGSVSDLPISFFTMPPNHAQYPLTPEQVWRADSNEDNSTTPPSSFRGTRVANTLTSDELSSYLTAGLDISSFYARANPGLSL